MATTIFIDRPIQDVAHNISCNISITRSALHSCTTDKKDSIRIALHKYERELQLLAEYWERSERKTTTFQKIAPLRKIDIDSYIAKCQRLARSVRWISFNKTHLQFVVRPTINGKRLYLGVWSNFDEAAECLGIYLNQLSKI